MKIMGKALLHILIILILTTSCSPKFMKSGEVTYNFDSDNMLSTSEELLSSYKENIVIAAVPEILSPLQNETDGLRYILGSYLNPHNSLFIGENNKEFLESSLLNSQSPYIPVTVENWEKIVQIIFSFEGNEKNFLKKYILDFATEDKIERQYAVSGLMNLLSLKYPLSLGGDNISLQKSEVISDLSDIDEVHRDLIREAFCLGFTDFSVDKDRLFRPSDYLSNGEAVSMLYRILSNLGIPVLEQTEASGEKQISTDEKKPSESDSDSFGIESILLEYNNYKTSLEKSNKASNKKRLEMLLLSEDIIGLSSDELQLHTIDKPLSIEKWAKILEQVFGLNPEMINPYLSFETDGTLPYDIAAISIFKLSEKLVGYDPRDATEKELMDARAAIPQFETARDTSKFAQMFSSGLLEGLYDIPGFTPQRPVNETEALLLVKRMTKGFTLK